ncbi:MULTISPECIES: glycosyltransferase family 4 protein [unclassified Actinopolyspora]|uniref:glycosyltransferase family 4 protein n=1 Tax=unclassified Actinopolyspora TaxID=2639451 RepID=UPI0013F65888|nr:MULTISPECIES: glycosyltransferase family 4 protein [unclassified Actinopolyspora]NHD16907.1 glycosyltransferase family 4 protein [Actinopolyspora sp. BKK2]NHE76059.1 glycosyltransferase family 4 protein [Actinopolyspora sp. BKK1]
MSGGRLVRGAPGRRSKRARRRSAAPENGVAAVITRLEGGAGIVALRSAVALVERRCPVTIVTGGGGELVEQAREAGVPVVIEPALCKPVRPRHDLVALWRLRALFARCGFDVVHTHTAKAGAVGRVAAWWSGTRRVVHTYHGFPFHSFQSAFRRGSYVLIERALGGITDVALCVGSGVTAEALRRDLVGRDRVRTTGVPVSRAVAPADPVSRRGARRALGVSEDRLLVGAVGRLTYQKSPEDLITALALLGREDVSGVWVGDGDRRAPVSRLVESELAGNFTLLGDCPNVPDLLPAFDVFVLPSRYEGLPLALAEAMRCGLPVVATDVNAVPDLVTAGTTGLLVPPERPDLLAAALARLLDSPAERATMGAAGRKRIDERFDIDTLVRALEEAYVDDRAEHDAK